MDYYGPCGVSILGLNGMLDKKKIGLFQRRRAVFSIQLENNDRAELDEHYIALYNIVYSRVQGCVMVNKQVCSPLSSGVNPSTFGKVKQEADFHTRHLRDTVSLREPQCPQNDVRNRDSSSFL
jgi:hypothetical protein